MTGILDLKELLKPMTPRDKMFEKILATNVKYENLFVLTVSTDSGDPVIQGYYEYDRAENGNDPASLLIGVQILRSCAAMLEGAGNDGDKEDSHSTH